MRRARKCNLKGKERQGRAGGKDGEMEKRQKKKATGIDLTSAKLCSGTDLKCTI